tara:strand:+ start:184960 stop:199311 length:14352 start_codon:yes stop_codon:yes gene_type:complete
LRFLNWLNRYLGKPEPARNLQFDSFREDGNAKLELVRLEDRIVLSVSAGLGGAGDVLQLNLDAANDQATVSVINSGATLEVNDGLGMPGSIIQFDASQISSILVTGTDSSQTVHFLGQQGLDLTGPVDLTGFTGNVNIGIDLLIGAGQPPQFNPASTVTYLGQFELTGDQLSVILPNELNLDDAFVIQINGANLEIIDSAHSNTLLFSTPTAGLNSIKVIGADGESDFLTLDYSVAGLTDIAISFDGGSGGKDALEFSGGIFDTVTHNLTGPGAGSIDFSGNSITEISYVGLEPVFGGNNTANNIEINIPLGTLDAVLENSAAPGEMQIRSLSADFELTTFASPVDSLTINTTGGNSIVALNSFDAAFAPTDLIISGKPGDTYQLTANDLLADTVSLTLSGGATLDLDTFNETVNVLVLEEGTIIATGGILTAQSDLDLRSGTVKAQLNGTDLIKNGMGTVILDAANGYAGQTIINDGTLKLARSYAIPTTSSVDLTAVTSVLDPNGFEVSLTSLTGSGKVLLGGAAGILDVNQAAATSSTFAGDISGDGSLSKSGSGEFILSGSSSFTGSTTVQDGSLKVEGTLKTTEVIVTANATLAGSGNIDAPVTLNSDGVLAPGSSPGIINAGDLTLSAGSLLDIEIDGTTAGLEYDQIQVTGAVDLTGATLNLTSAFTAAAGNEFLLIDNDDVDAVTGEFAGLAEGTLFSFNGNQVYISYVGGDGNDVVLTVNSPPATSNQIFSLDENTINTTSLGSITATDPDLPPDSLTFSVTGGTGQTAFSVSASGEITVADETQLDYETTTSFDLEILVTDSAGETDTATITINLNPLNDNAPIVNNQVLNADENTLNGTNVGAVIIATDADLPNDTLTFSATGGSGAAAFAISSNGQITVADQSLLDYETTTSFELDILVTDGAGATDTATITINLNPLNDNAPVIVNQIRSVDENAVNGTNVGAVLVATDDDLPGDTLTYSEAGGTGAAAFDITAGGQIVVADQSLLNFEANASYAFDVIVDDNNGSTSTATITINLNDLVETLVIDAADWSVNDITLVRDGSQLRVLETGTMNEIVPSHNFANISSVIITGNGAGNTVRLDISGGDITPAGGISFDGGAGSNTLVAANQANDWLIDGVNAGRLLSGSVTFTNVENLQGGSDVDTFSISGSQSLNLLGGLGNDVFQFIDDASLLNGTIDGQGGTDHLDLTNYTADLMVKLSGIGSADGFNGSEAANSVTFANIDQLTGGTGANTLTGINNSASWTLNGTNTYLSTNSLSFSIFINLTGGSEADTFDVTPAAEAFNITGGDPGSNPFGDQLNIDTSAVGTALVTSNGSDAGSVTGAFPAITYSEIENFAISGVVDIQIDGTSNNDLIEILVVGSDIEYRLGGTLIGTSSLSETNSITVYAGDGDDSLTVDSALAAAGITVTYDGEGNNSTNPGDVLSLLGTTTSVEYYFTNSSSGSIRIDGALTDFIVYSGLEPITSTINATNVTLNYSGVSETITISDAGSGQTTVTSTAGEMLTFTNPTSSLIINTGAGDDIVDLNSLTASFTASLTINGDADNDTVNANSSVSFNTGKTITFNVETINVANAITLTAAGIAFNANEVNLDGDLVSTNVSGDAATVNVLGSVGGADIQDAVDVAGTGGIINVATGIYHTTGTLNVDESVSILGAGKDVVQIRKAGAPTSSFDIAVNISANNVTISGAQLGWETHTSATDYLGYVVYTTADNTTLNNLLFSDNYRSAVVFEGADHLEVSDSIFEGKLGRAAIRDGDSGSGENFLITRNEFREDHFRWGPISIGPQGTFGDPNNFAFSGVISFNYFGNGIQAGSFQEAGDQNYTVTITNGGMTADGIDIIHNTFDWQDSATTNGNGIYAQPGGVYFDPSLSVALGTVNITDNIFNGFTYDGPQPTTDPLWNPAGGVFGGALEFDGVDDFGLFQDANFDVGESGTLSFWVNMDDQGRRNQFFEGPNNGGMEFQYRTNSGGQFYGSPNRNDGNGNTYVIQDGGAGGTTGVWQNIQYTWDYNGGVNPQMHLYIDGVEVGYLSTTYDSDLAQWTATVSTVNELMNVGRDPGDTTRFFDGLMDDVAWFDQALNQTDLDTIRTTGVATLAADTRLVAHWDFDQSSGNIAIDNKNGIQMLISTNGIVPFGPEFQTAAGQFGGALEFDGIDDFATFQDASFDVGRKGTLNFWVKMDDVGKRNQFFEGPDDGGMEFQYRTNGGGQFYGRTQNGADFTIQQGGQSGVAGVWTNIQYTWDADTGEMHIYLNGSEEPYLSTFDQNLAGFDSTHFTDTVNGLMNVGRDPGDPSRSFDGLMDDIGWFNDVLDSIDRADIMNNGVTALTGDPRLVAHWNLDDAPGTTVVAGNSGTSIVLYLQAEPPLPPIQGFGVIAPLNANVTYNAFNNNDLNSNVTLDATNIIGDPLFAYENDPLYVSTDSLDEQFTIGFGSSAAYTSSEFAGDTNTTTPHIGAYQNPPTVYPGVYGTGDIVIYGTGEDDLLELTLTGENTATFVLTRDFGGAGQIVLDTVFLTDITSITFNGLGGDDVLILNQPDNLFFNPSGGIIFNGGSQNNDGNALGIAGLNGDTLVINHNMPLEADSVSYVFTPDSVPAEGEDGNITITDSSMSDGSTTITFTGLEPIIDHLLVADRIFDFTDADETISLSDDGVASDHYSFIDSTLSESVLFLNPTSSITIRTDSAGTAVGVDTVLINSLDSFFDASLTILAGSDDSVTFQTNTNLVTGDLFVTAESVNILADIDAASVEISSSGVTSTTFGVSPRTVTTTGSQIYHDAVNLGVSTTFTSTTTGDITFNSSVTGGGGINVDLSSTENIILNGAFATDGNVTATADSDSSGAGDFTMQVGSSLDAGSGTIDIDGANVTTRSLTTTNSSATSISIAANNGNVITKDGGVNSLGDITINATGTITLEDDGVNTGDGGSVIIKAQSDITSTGAGINTTLGAASGGVVTLTSSLGRVDVSNGNVLTGDGGNINIDAVTGFAAINASFDTTAGTGGGDVEVNVSAGSSSITNGGITVNDAGTILLTAKGVTSDILISAGLTSADGSITILADNDITLTSNAKILSQVSGTITLTADAASNGNGSNITMKDSVTEGALIDAGSGEIILSTDGNILLGGLLTTGNVSLTSASIIDNGDFHTDIVASTAVLTTTAGIGVGNPLETEISTLTATVSGIGGLFIDNTIDVELLDISTFDGNITLNATGTITATSVVSTNDSASDDNDIILTATGSNSDILVTTITAVGNADVTLTADDGILDSNDADTNRITADNLTLTSSSAGGTQDGIDVDTDVNSLTADVNTNAGGIRIGEVDAVTLTQVTTADGFITINSGGTIKVLDVNSANSSASDTANGITLTATGADSDIIVTTLTAQNTADITLNSDRDVLDSNSADMNITAGDLLTIVAGRNIGGITSIFTEAGFDPLQTTVDHLDLTSGNIIAIHNTDTTPELINLDAAGTGAGTTFIKATNGALDVSMTSGISALMTPDHIGFVSDKSITVPTGLQTENLRLDAPDIFNFGGGNIVVNAVNSILFQSDSTTNSTVTVEITAQQFDGTATGSDFTIINNSPALQLFDLNTDSIALAGGTDTNVSLTSTGSITVTNLVQTLGTGTLFIGTTDTTADLILNENIQSETGSVTIETADDIIFNGTTSLTSTSGSIVLTADADSGAGGIFGGITMSDGSFINAGDGTVKLDATDDITLGQIITTNATDFAIHLETDSSIIDAGDSTGEDLIANETGARVTIVAALGAGKVADANGEIETQVDQINITNLTSGEIQIIETDAIVIHDILQTTAGDIRVISGGNMLLSGLIETVSDGVVLDSQAAIIDQNDGLPDPLNIHATSLTLKAVTGIGIGNTLEISVDTFAADSTDGDILLHNTASTAVTATSITTGTGNIQLSQLGNESLTVDLATTHGGTITVSNTGDAQTDLLTLTSLSAGGATPEINVSTIGFGNILLGDLTALEGVISVTSAGEINDAVDDLGLPIVDLNAASGSITLQAVNGIGNNDRVELSGGTLSINTTTGNIDVASISSTDTGFVGILRLTTGGGTIDFLQTGGQDAAFEEIATTGSAVTIESDGSIVFENFGMLSNVVSTDGAGTIQVTATGVNSSIQVNDGFSTVGGTIDLTAQNSLNFGSDGDLNTSNGKLTLVADSVSAGVGGGGIAMSDGTVFNTGTGIVDLQAGDNIAIGQLITTTLTRLTSTAGGVLDAGDTGGKDITADELVIRTVAGAGSANPLETAVSMLAAANTDSGSIQIHNDLGGLLLTIGTVDGVAGITNSASVAGDIIITNASPLTVDSPVTNSSGGNIDLESTGPGNLTLNASVRASGGNGNINVEAGNGILDINDTGLASDHSVAGTGVFSGHGSGGVLIDSNATLNSQTGAIAGVPPDLRNILTPQILATGQAMVTGDFGRFTEQNFFITIDWGDGTVETFNFDNPGSFVFEHTYIGNPNNANPAADIPILVTMQGDMQFTFTDGSGNLDFTSQSGLLTTPGEGFANVAIDTTPQVPHLVFPRTEVVLDSTSNLQSVFTSKDTISIESAINEANKNVERLVFLRILAPNGNVIEDVPLEESDLDNLPQLFKSLPDGRYQIYLKEAGEERIRLLMDIDIRGGKATDVSEDQLNQSSSRDTQNTTGEESSTQLELEESELISLMENWLHDGLQKLTTIITTDADAAETQSHFDFPERLMIDNRSKFEHTDLSSPEINQKQSPAEVNTTQLNTSEKAWGSAALLSGYFRGKSLLKKPAKQEEFEDAMEKYGKRLLNRHYQMLKRDQ